MQTILGHASAAFTLTVYGHMFDEDLDAALGSQRGDLARTCEPLQSHSESIADVGSSGK